MTLLQERISTNLLQSISYCGAFVPFLFRNSLENTILTHCVEKTMKKLRSYPFAVVGGLLLVLFLAAQSRSLIRPQNIALVKDSEILSSVANTTQASSGLHEVNQQTFITSPPIKLNNKQPTSNHDDSNRSQVVYLQSLIQAQTDQNESLTSNNTLVPLTGLLNGSITNSTNTPAITYSLSKAYSQKSMIDIGYQCVNCSTPQKSIDRYFDFVTEIQTSLNILFLGDSIAVLMAKAAEIASGGMNETSLHFAKWGPKRARYLVPIVEAASVNGGGVIASWRLTGFLRRWSMNRLLPNNGPGWREKFATSLKDFAKTHGRKSNFDVLVFRVSHPWIATNEVTWEALEETVVMAKSLLGVKTVILLTSGFNNNILTMDDLQGFREMNNKIRNYARNESSPHDIRVLEIEQYTDELILYNAQEIGFTNETLEELYFHKMKPFRTLHGSAAKTIPQLCAERVPDNSKECSSKNAFSFDGLHPCIATVGPRIFAALACLLQCVVQDRVCQDSCTSKFMVPLREIKNW